MVSAENTCTSLFTIINITLICSTTVRFEVIRSGYILAVSTLNFYYTLSFLWHKIMQHIVCFNEVQTKYILYFMSNSAKLQNRLTEFLLFHFIRFGQILCLRISFRTFLFRLEVHLSARHNPCWLLPNCGRMSLFSIKEKSEHFYIHLYTLLFSFYIPKYIKQKQF